ncbi:DUF917 domain-containing protein [Galactobacter sp.]|uniref:DUF917 domain-containing protein n=1 Tax=Galactobacter sp. TaxID=2676125 RepID=UPI0025C727B2|nr:DUF917 domain-containing protein [Galactobacter sp.]
MLLSNRDMNCLYVGTLFNSCAVSHEWCKNELDLIWFYMEQMQTQVGLIQASALNDQALVVTVGFVNNGQPITELRPAGDEFIRCIRILESSLGNKVEGLIPLAAGNVNALVVASVSLQTGIPVVDADPMGRVFPRASQTVLALGRQSIGPLAAAGATGEASLIHVSDPERGDRLMRALAGEYGGWAATASYPMTASELEENAVIGSMSHLIDVGKILESEQPTQRRYAQLRRDAGVNLIIRGMVKETDWTARTSLPGHARRPAQIVLEEVGTGRIIQLAIQDEILMLMIDGAVRSIVPDIITLIRPDTGSVAALDDLWPGNTVDILTMSGPKQWYTPQGLDMAGPAAFNLLRRTAVDALWK